MVINNNFVAGPDSYSNIDTHDIDKVQCFVCIDNVLML